MIEFTILLFCNLYNDNYYIENDFDDLADKLLQLKDEKLRKRLSAQGVEKIKNKLLTYTKVKKFI